MELDATRPRAMVTINATEVFLKFNMRFLLKVKKTVTPRVGLYVWEFFTHGCIVRGKISHTIAF